MKNWAMTASFFLWAWPKALCRQYACGEGPFVDSGVLFVRFPADESHGEIAKALGIGLSFWAELSEIVGQHDNYFFSFQVLLLIFILRLVPDFMTHKLCKSDSII